MNEIVFNENIFLNDNMEFISKKHQEMFVNLLVMNIKKNNCEKSLAKFFYLLMSENEIEEDIFYNYEVDKEDILNCIKKPNEIKLAHILFGGSCDYKIIDEETNNLTIQKVLLDDYIKKNGKEHFYEELFDILNNRLDLLFKMFDVEKFNIENILLRAINNIIKITPLKLLLDIENNYFKDVLYKNFEWIKLFDDNYIKNNSKKKINNLYQNYEEVLDKNNYLFKEPHIIFEKLDIIPLNIISEKVINKMSEKYLMKLLDNQMFLYLNIISYISSNHDFDKYMQNKSDLEKEKLIKTYLNALNIQSMQGEKVRLLDIINFVNFVKRYYTNTENIFSEEFYIYIKRNRIDANEIKSYILMKDLSEEINTNHIVNLKRKL